MRLRELEQHEAGYLIVNGWARYRVRADDVWYHPEHAPKEGGLILGLDDAVRFQKARDRGIAQELVLPRRDTGPAAPRVTLRSGEPCASSAPGMPSLPALGKERIVFRGVDADDPPDTEPSPSHEADR